MLHPRLTLGRLFWVVWACLLFAPHAAAAATPVLLADFDGDGQRDGVSLSRRDPSVLRLWLSASRRTVVLRTEAPVQRFAAADLDGDRSPELIMGDGEGRLHVWSRKQKRLKSYRPRALTPVTFADPTRRQAEDDDTVNPQVSSGELTSSPPVALPPPASIPALVRLPARVLCADQPFRSAATIDCFLARPPPSLHTL